MRDRIKELIEIDWLNDLNDLQPDNIKLPYNYEALKRSILKHGFSFPFAVWHDGSEYYTVDGHTRRTILTELKAEGHNVPDKLKAFEIEAIDRQEAIKILLDVYNSKSNPIAEEVLLEWLEDEEIEVGDVEMESLNISIELEDDETHIEASEDDYVAPDTIQTDIVKGDLFEFKKGELTHRLLCGDSTNVGTWGILFENQLADLIITDPPYNVSYVGKTEKALTIQNDEKTDSEFYQFLYDFYTALNSYTKEGGAWYVWHASSEIVNFAKAFKDAGILLKQQLIWVKQTMVMGRQDYHWKHEPCLYGWKPGAAHNWYSDRKQTTVLEFDRPMRNAEHPTMKPTQLIGYQIENSSKIGDIVADGFLGSHTTMVAAHQLNRNCYGMELDEKYCQVGVDRMLTLDPDIQLFRNGEDVTDKYRSRLETAQ